MIRFIEVLFAGLVGVFLLISALTSFREALALRGRDRFGMRRNIIAMGTVLTVLAAFVFAIAVKKWIGVHQ